MSTQKNKINGMDTVFPEEKQYLILDWSNVVFRALFVAPDRFVDQLILMLYNYRKYHKNYEFVIAQEGKGADLRRSILPDYKHNRVHTEESVRCILKSFDLLNFVSCTEVMAISGEADDAIASFIKQKAKGKRVIISSEDKDLWQLVSNSTTVKSKRFGDVTPTECREKLGVMPENVPMLKALIGDRSDNIPKSVPRIGDKKLTDVARKAKTIKELMASVERGDIEGKLAEKITSNKDTILRNLNLVRLQSGLPLKIRKVEPNVEDLYEFCKAEGTRSFTNDYLSAVCGIVKR